MVCADDMLSPPWGCMSFPGGTSPTDVSGLQFESKRTGRAYVSHNNSGPFSISTTDDASGGVKS